MGKLERNTIDNLAGTAWSIALGLVSVPFLIRYLGAEAFGLTGFFLTIQSLCTILDLGIGATVSREMPRLVAGDAPAAEQRDLVFTLQAIYWTAAVVVGVVVFAAAPLIASHWLKPQQLSPETVQLCIRMMGVAVALQFPLAFYRCALLGLHRTGLFNAIFGINAVLRWPVAVIAVMVSPRPETFFAVQIVTGFVGTGAAALLLWRCLPVAAEAARLQSALVVQLWRFAALYSANSTALLMLQQADKLIVSSILSLESFGYYSLAQRLAGGIYGLIASVNGATFPHLSAAAAHADEAAVARLYHRGCQLMAVLIGPIAAITVCFPKEVLLLWTRSATAVENVHVPLALAAAGMLVHAIIQGPHYLQVAYGSWRLITITNLGLLATILPACVFLAGRYGAAGAASVSLLLNAAYLLTVPLVHRRFARGELRRWFFQDVFLPIGGAFAVAGGAYALMPGGLGWAATFAYLCAVGAATVAVAALVSTAVRPALGLNPRSRTPQPEIA